MDIFKKDIVMKFFRYPSKVNFILSFIMNLNEWNERLAELEDGNKKKDNLIAELWEFKRWFWSFLENAVLLHTTIIEVDEDLLRDFDVDLIIKYLKSEGVLIVILPVD